MQTIEGAYVNGAASAMPVSMIEVEDLSSPNPVEADVPAESGKVINRLRDLKTSARDQLMIDPRIILIDDSFNPRNYDLPENHAHLDALKRSIRENGTLVPLLVRYDAERKAAVLVDGECRLRANLELIAEGVEIDTVPTIQVPGGNESDRLLVAITANTGKPLSKWELGGAFQRLYNHGWSPAKISTRTGYAESFVAEAMELADAPDEVKRLLSSQAVTPALALSELRTNGAAAVSTLQTIASEHKASGKKGPAKRAKAPAKTAAPAKAEAAPAQAKSSIPQSSITKAILSLVEDVPAEDMNSDDPDAEVLVKLSKILKLLDFVVTSEDLKAVGAKAK
jgi:ParB-like chromosome segregation protein Spo0J